MKLKSSRIIIKIVLILSILLLQEVKCCWHPLQSTNSLCPFMTFWPLLKSYKGGNYCYCVGCKSGYSVDQTQMACCENTIQNCNSCLGNINGFCAECNSNYKLNQTAGFCYLCSEQTGCLQCSNSYSCDICVDQYYLNSGKCDFCSTSAAFCTQCTNVTGFICSNCQNNTFALVNNTCSYCSILIKNCQTCASQTFCTSCKALYEQDNNGSCFLMCLIWMEQCSNCSSDIVCITCTSDIYAINLVNSKDSCTPCNDTLDYCQRCLNPQKCIQCDDDPSLYLKRDGNLSNMSEPGGFYGSSQRFTGNYGRCIFCNVTYPLCIRCDNNFCLECTPSSQIAYTATKMCKPCQKLLQFCITCKNQFTCTSCQVNKLYILHKNVNGAACTYCSKLMVDCVLCSQSTACETCLNAKIVTGGCTKVKGCTAVEQRTDNTAICIKCDERDFQDIPFKQQCVCLQGWIVGQYCTTIIGCTRLAYLDEVKGCISCNASMNMIVMNKTCICKDMYVWNGNTCEQICGDGRLFDLECDDGNLIDGDGCSSQCKEEVLYRCRDGSISTASKCKFIGLIEYELKQIAKIPDYNKILVTYEMKPFTSLFLKMNLSSISFTTSANTTLDKIQVEQPFIKFYLSYFQNIDNASALLNINYDLQLISNPRKKIQTKIVSKIEPFTYDPNPWQYKAIIEMIFKYMPIVILITTFLCSFSQKMIAVQTLQTYQLICICHVFSKKYTYVFKYMSSMMMTLGQSNTFFNRQLTQNEYLKLLKYSSSIMDNYSLVGLSLIIAIFIFLLLKILQKNTTKHNEIIGKVTNKMYESIVFFLAIGFYYHFVLSMQDHFISNDNEESFFVVLLSIVCFIVISTIISTQVLKVFLNINQVQFNSTYQNYSYKYVGYYLLLMVGIQLALQVSICWSTFYFVYMASFMFILLVLLIIIKRPYKHILHNLALLFNLSVLGFNLGWIIAEEMSNKIIPYRNQLTMVLTISLVLVSLMAVIRVILNIKMEIKWREQQKANILKNMSQKKQIQKFHKFYYKVQEKVNNQPKEVQNVEVECPQKKNGKQVMNLSIFNQFQQGKIHQQYNLQQQKISKRQKLLKKNNNFEE